MNNSSAPSRGVQQLDQIKQSGSARIRTPEDDDRQPIRTVQSEPQKSKGLFKLFERFKQTAKEGKEETRLHATRVENRREVEEYRDEECGNSERYGIQMDRLVDQDRMEKRAQKQLRRSTCIEAIELTDAIELLTFYNDARIGRLGQIQDDELREISLKAIRASHSHMIADLQAAVIGRKYEPDSIYRNSF